MDSSSPVLAACRPLTAPSSAARGPWSSCAAVPPGRVPCSRERWEIRGRGRWASALAAALVGWGRGKRKKRMGRDRDGWRRGETRGTAALAGAVVRRYISRGPHVMQKNIIIDWEGP